MQIPISALPIASAGAGEISAVREQRPPANGNIVLFTPTGESYEEF